FDDARTRKADHTCLASGFIDTADLKNQPVTFFSTHEHADHFNNSIFAYRENLPAAEYILCFEPVGVSDEYTYLPVNSETEIDGMKIYVIKSTDSGGGYLVEVDGLTIFHMGDHANGDDVLSAAYSHEIEIVAAKHKDIDILFGPIRGCSLGTPEQVKTGTYYTVEKLHPSLFVPMHSGSYTFQNKIFTDQARENGLTQNMKYLTAKGDRFEYRKGEAMVNQNSDLPATF
ncbi:MAG: hypothetical protein HGA23_08350, partial [Bacteroidales bacterium]|nr:hypothetical protein [Bacteroidales bacterium]